MTEKRFQYNVNKNSIEYNEKHFAYCNIEQNKIANRLNELNDENQVLRETLKNQYMNEICETCVYGEYWCNSYGEGEFECHKGYDGSECDGKTECDDFELNIKGMNIRMVEE